MKERKSTLRWLIRIAGRVRLCVAGLTLAQVKAIQKNMA